jgi:hypothetical protein
VIRFVDLSAEMYQLYSLRMARWGHLFEIVHGSEQDKFYGSELLACICSKYCVCLQEHYTATFLKLYLVIESCTETSERRIPWSWNELGVSNALKTWVEGEKSGHVCFQKWYKVFWKYNRCNLCLAKYCIHRESRNHNRTSKILDDD